MPYWQVYSFAAVSLIIGVVAAWRGGKFSGWRVLGNCLWPTALSCLLLAAYFQFRHLLC